MGQRSITDHAAPPHGTMVVGATECPTKGREAQDPGLARRPEDDGA